MNPDEDKKKDINSEEKETIGIELIPPEDRPKEGEDLLVLILEAGKISQSSAAKTLDVSDETIGQWASALEKEGWIKKRDLELKDPLLEFSDKSKKRISELKKELIAGEEEKETIKKKRPSIGGFVKGVISSIKRLIFLIIKNKIDTLIVISTILSLYLLRAFIRDPNREMLSFLVAAILFSVVILVYRTYEKVLKTKRLVDVIERVINMIKARRKYITSSLLLLISIYFLGSYILDQHHKIHNILIAVLTLSIMILKHQPERTIWEKLRFCYGMVLLTCAILLVTGFASAVQMFIPERYRLIDISIGFLVMILLQMNEDYFGISVSSFKGMMIKEEKK